jgi:peptidoglycan/LPS O-acetylase OafA/YrhL
MSTLRDHFPPVGAAPSPEPAAAQRRRFDSLDGLRALACLAVLCHHCYIWAGRYQWPVVELSGQPLSLSRLLSYGYLGVEIFFVLSGFCLAYPLLCRAGEPIDWRRYFASRARRILPPYWAALLLFAGMSALITGLQVMPFAASDALQTPQTKHLILGVLLTSVVYNSSFWTLCLEARWYLALPLLIRLHARLRMPGVLAVCVIVSLLFMELGHRLPGRLQFLIGPLPLFLPLFGLGIALAEIASRTGHSGLAAACVRYRRWGLLLAVALVGCFTPAEPDLGFHYSRIVPAGLLGFFLVLMALYDPLVRRWLSYPPLVALGGFSYSLYLIHLPFIHLTYAVTKTKPFPDAIQFLIYQGIVLPVCVLLGYLFYRVAEKPFLQRRPVS